ncbi:MAG: D-alanine--D-alanine ligase [Endomicrobium sp.]|nr:D-alanine--D-alanine ligase [Endomicrobium sp.]
MRNKKIGVLYGGLSRERDISVISGKAVLNVFEKLKINACGIDVDRNVCDKIKKEKIDIAFIALHGYVGEDGVIQGMLEMLGIPYTGCGIFGSSASINKDISKQFFQFNGILTPEWKVLKKSEALPEIKQYPIVVKPVLEGSTIGVLMVKKASHFAAAVKEAFKYGEEIIIEQFVDGKEITVSVLNGKVLPIIEILHKGDLYDFNSKYKKGFSRYVIPADITKKSYKKARDFAEKIYKIFKCNGMCRVDMVVDKKDKVWVLENNTVPGMTENSLLPAAGAAAGYDFESLVLEIVESTLKNGKKKALCL